MRETATKEAQTKFDFYFKQLLDKVSVSEADKSALERQYKEHLQHYKHSLLNDITNEFQAIIKH